MRDEEQRKNIYNLEESILKNGVESILKNGNYLKKLI
jgi:hypothetical protein